MVHTLSVAVPVGTQQKAGAARRRLARSATNLMSQPTCDTLAEDTDSVWPSATAWQQDVPRRMHPNCVLIHHDCVLLIVAANVQPAALASGAHMSAW